MKKLTYILLVFLLFASTVLAGSFKPYAFPFIGRWQPSEDPVLIDDYGFQDIQNLRKDGKRLKGVSGHTKVNTSVWNATYAYPKNGFHFKKDQPSESHVIVSADNSAGTSPRLYQNTTAIPSQGNFSGTILHTDAASANLGRFSMAPKGNMAYCNGEETLIWGGDELTATSFIVSTDAITGTITAPKDFSKEIMNTRQTADEVAQITDGLDAYAVLMLHCDGDDASTTFTDSSTTPHTATAQGDAQIDVDFRKFGTGAGIFDATGDYLSIPDHADFNYGTDKVTIEAWVRFDSDTGQHTIYSQSTGADYIEIWQDQDANKVWFAVASGGSRLIHESATWNPTISTWCHLALIRGWGGNANDWAITVDGSAIHTFTDSSTLPDLAAVLYIGSSGADEIDFGDTFHALTYFNTAANSTTQKKWGDGSLYLDGNSDYIQAADHADWDIQTNFTIDLWVKHTDHVGDEPYIGQLESATDHWVLYHSHGSGIEFRVRSNNVFVVQTGLGGEITDTDWHHVAVCKVGNEYGVYLDGTQVCHTSDADTDTFAGNLTFGFENALAGYFDGYLDEARITHDNAFSAAPVAGLTDTITVPASAHTSDSNTKLLLHFNIKDFSGHKDEYRISKGVARWTSNFTPSVRPYKNIGRYWLVGTTRPIQGIKYYVNHANTTTSTMTAKEWNGASWSNLTITDNTASGGVSLAQTGTVTWSTTKDTSETAMYSGLSLFWYQFNLSAGEAEIYYCTVDAPIQTIENIWGGSPSKCTGFHVYDASKWEDYTLHVNSASTAEYASSEFAAELDDLTAAEYVYVSFSEQTQAVNFTMTPKINANAATITVSYWDGSAWVSVGTVTDGTAEGGISLAKSGYVSWNSPGREEEFTQNLFSLSGVYKDIIYYPNIVGQESHTDMPLDQVKSISETTHIFENTQLYIYKFQWSAVLSADVLVDIVEGVPTEYPIKGYKFSVMYQNRLFLFSEKAGPKNTCIYSAFENPDTLNGSDSGMIVFGDDTELTAAAPLYNLYRTAGIEQLVITKKHETYRITGYGPSSWEKYKMSATIGCVAPLSMATCDIAMVEEGVKRQVVVWQSDTGVVMTDGATLDFISNDIACYWDANDSRCIPTARLGDSVGWYDSNLRAYKLLISSGVQQTTHNVELEYSLETGEWTKLYRENGSGANPLQTGFITHDTNGKAYTFGATNEAFMYRLENGKTWDSTGIEQIVHTKDLMLDSEQPLFKHTNIDYLRLIFEDKATGAGEDIDILHYCDQTQTTHGTNDQSVPTDIDMADGPHELRECTLGPCLYHSFKFTATTSTVADGMELTGLGLLVDPVETIME